MTRTAHTNDLQPEQRTMFYFSRIIAIGLSAASLLLSSNIAIADELSAWHNSALNSITSDDLQTHVDVLADDSFEGREAGSRGGRAAGTYLLQFIEKHGLDGGGHRGGFVQSFGDGYRNILGLLQGSDPQLKHEVVIVGAHYDHVGYGTSRNSYGPTGYIHNGADDNASGTAGVLEIIEAFSQFPKPPRRTILFAFWDGEEKGLLGSKHWVRHPTLDLDRVVLAINTDMIGRLRSRRLQVHGTRTMTGLRRLVSLTNRDIGLELDFTWEIKSNSDHYSFYSRNIPVLMAHTGLHEDYHRPGDDAHKINSEGMQEVSRLLFNIALEVADRPSVNRFRAAARQELPNDRTRLERPMAPRPSRLGVLWQGDPEPGQGLLLTKVRPNSAAQRAGLRPGDRLLKFGGQDFVGASQFRAAVLSSRSKVQIEIARSGEPKPRQMTVELDGKPSRIGVSWRVDSAEPNSVVLTLVVPDSPAQQAGLQLGDRLYEVAGQVITDSNQLVELLTTLPSPIDLLVERRGRLQEIQMILPDILDSGVLDSGVLDSGAASSN